MVPEQLEDLGRVERHLAVARVRRQGQLRAQVLLEEVPPPQPHELDAVLEAEVEEPAREVLEDALREHPLEAEGAGAAPAQRRVRLVDPARELLRPPPQILVEAVARRVAPRRAQDLQRLLQGPAPRHRVLEDVRPRDLVELLVAADDAGQRVEREPEPPVWESNLQPDFNASKRDSFDASSSTVLRELDKSNRFVQKSAESTSI